MFKTLLATILFISLSAQALDLDKKVVARVLGVSDSKKTMLLNKGREDGLKEGDHAKISISSGMVARAVISRISPSRSVWSIYRFYDKDKVLANIAVTVKIASPIELTVDETKNLGILAKKYGKKETEEIPDDKTRDEKVKDAKLARNFINKERVISHFDQEDYTSLEDDGMPKPLDPDIDWSALDGKKDLDKVDPNADFSTVH